MTTYPGTRIPLTKELMREHYARLKKFPKQLEPVPAAEWPEDHASDGVSRIAVWRSRDFLVQIADEHGHIRLSVSRTSICREKGDWHDGITWDELMQIKSDVGMGGDWAIEIFPPDNDVVNVANIRHLWITKERPPQAWSRHK